MADLSNITQFSGITITSDQTTGSNNPQATFAVSSLTQTQINNLENVTSYTVGANTVKVKPGTMVFNITSNIFQIFINGVWQNVFSVNTTATGIGLTNRAPFVYPSGQKENVEVAANQLNGFIYMQSDAGNALRIYQNNKWGTITVTLDA